MVPNKLAMPLPLVATSFIGVVIGSIAPDIDCPTSSIGRVLPFLSRPIYALCRHRTLTHGAFALGVLMIFAVWIDRYHAGWKILVLSFVLGYASHIVGDVFCDGGVQAAWPTSRWRLKIWPHLKTGSICELMAGHIVSTMIALFAYFRCPNAFDIIRTMLDRTHCSEVLTKFTKMVRQIRQQAGCSNKGTLNRCYRA